MAFVSRASFVLSLALCASASSSTPVDKTLVRTEKKAIEIDQHSAMKHTVLNEGMIAAEVQEHDASSDNPCSSLGCNSHKCAWVTGEVIERVSPGKSCKNTHALGSQVEDESGNKIQSLTQCVRAIKTQLTQSQTTGSDEGDAPKCSPFFELHKDTFRCSCVPEAKDCEETEDQGVCRFHLKEY